MEKEKFSNIILEPACGEGHISKVLQAHGYIVFSYDKVNRGFGGQRDFFEIGKLRQDFDIITNPPYKQALDFVKHALDIVHDGSKVAMFLRLLFLESKVRAEFFKKCPPKIVYVSARRLTCAKNGDFERYKGSNAQAFAWFIWQKGYKGQTVVDWINL